jgi:hypothetical protein
VKLKSARKVQGKRNSLALQTHRNSFLQKKCAPRGSNPEPID